jgi:acetyltransferase
MTIEQLGRAGLDQRVDEFAELLRDCVDGGASVGFLPPLGREEAAAYWRSVAPAVAGGTRLLFAAFEDGRLAGSVQLDLPGMPNGRHRAEIMKLLVTTRERNRGVGAALMARAEAAAREHRRMLVVLDTRTGDNAERLYQRLGYAIAGVIPDYALNDRGIPHATTIMYRRLDT